MEGEVMADPLDYERQHPPLPRSIDWGLWGAIAYLTLITVAILFCVLLALFLGSIQKF